MFHFSTERAPQFLLKPFIVFIGLNNGPVLDHFTVVCLVAWPLDENEAGGDLVLIEISLLFVCKFLLINMRTASLT